MASEVICLDDLLQCLVECSEKSAHIAQVFREEDDLFHLLVEEKSEKEKNKRFVRDFKTLADVLVQETIKRDVGLRFPSLASSIRGEEENSFQNALGESIRVELTDDEATTVRLLGKVLDGRQGVARALARAIHSTSTCDRQLSSSTLLQADSVGVWIDPIDSTAEYIQAKPNDANDHGIQLYGLKCVSVLIGAYDVHSGSPIMGVVNQPFFKRNTENSRWLSQFYWAVNYGSEQLISHSLTIDSLTTDSHDTRIIVLSSNENPELKKIIASKYKTVYTAGAGYKSLLVACRTADLYVLSPGTTYFWDTCGPHALLSTQGGGMVTFEDALTLEVTELHQKQVAYLPREGATGTDAFRNSAGIIAYRNPEVLMEFIGLLRKSGYKTVTKDR